jgi:hypothetical protein
LKGFNEKKNNYIDDETTEEGLSTKELVDATYRIKGRKFSTQQMYENYIVPLVNAGYIDKTDNQKDKRSYIFFPVLNAKQKKLFGLDETNNFSQDKQNTIMNSTLFPDKKYLISKIQWVLRYSSERHVITKLENHQGQEITPDELVEQYYNADRYFEDNNDKAKPPEDVGTIAATTDTIRTSIERQPQCTFLHFIRFFLNLFRYSFHFEFILVRCHYYSTY